MTPEAEIIWVKRASLPLHQYLSAISVRGDSLVEVAGTIARSAGGSDLYLGAFDMNGSQIWDFRYPLNGNVSEITQVLSDQADEINVVGNFGSPPSLRSGLFLSVDLDGHVLNSMRYGEVDADYPGRTSTAIVDTAGGYLVAGHIGIPGTYFFRPVLIRTEGVPSDDCESCGTPFPIIEQETVVTFTATDMATSDGLMPIEWSRVSIPYEAFFDPCLATNVAAAPGAMGTITASVQEGYDGITVDLAGWDGTVYVQVCDALGKIVHAEQRLGNGRVLIPVPTAMSAVYLIRAWSASHQAVAKVLMAK